MLAVNCLDGNVVDWNMDRQDRCLCDVTATIVCRIEMHKSDFESGVERLARRRSARAEFVRRKLVCDRLVGETGLSVVDENKAFQLDDEFEDLFGREPLEAFIRDAEETVHRCLGEFFRSVTYEGGMTSPMNAGKAFRLVPARSFATAAALSAFERGKRSKWFPSVRVEFSFVVVGEATSVSAVLSGFPSAMSECGVVTQFEQSMRKPDLAGVFHVRPLLAEVGRTNSAEVGQVK